MADVLCNELWDNVVRGSFVKNYENDPHKKLRIASFKVGILFVAS